MRLRQNYPISDRIKLLLILFFVLLLLGMIACQKHERLTKSPPPTMEKMLQTALEPVGSTMYIWGGGWDDEDSQSGGTSTQIGVSPQWALFAKKQDETYNFEEYRFERELGLDCSGYIGWVLYNTFEIMDGQTGYVLTSTDMAERFAEYGFGTLLTNPQEFLPGDIVSMDGHVWMSLGTCADGSVLLIHSSPPGVSICGTPVPKQKELAETEEPVLQENEKSIAIQLAEEFMETFYPKWQQKYPNRAVSASYLENVTLMRWNTNTLSDAKEWQALSGEEVLLLSEQ